MPHQTTRVFLIRRLGVELQVVVHSSGLINIKPFQCKNKNLRLWTGIATTQLAWAQLQLANDKASDPFRSLQAHFQNSGWEPRGPEANADVQPVTGTSANEIAGWAPGL